MVTAAAPTALNAPAVPISPSTSAQAPNQAQQKPFHEMYRASHDDESDSDAKSKDTSPTGIKKRASGDTADKTGAPAIAAKTGTTPAKVPLLFSMPALGLLVQEAYKETSADGKDQTEFGGDASAQASSDGAGA